MRISSFDWTHNLHTVCNILICMQYGMYISNVSFIVSAWNTNTALFPPWFEKNTYLLNILLVLNCWCFIDFIIDSHNPLKWNYPYLSIEKWMWYCNLAVDRVNVSTYGLIKIGKTVLSTWSFQLFWCRYLHVLFIVNIINVQWSKEGLHLYSFDSRSLQSLTLVQKVCKNSV